MRRMISWVLVGMMVLSGCASSTPPPMETETDTSEAARLPEVLSSLKSGDHIEIWTQDGECFEAEFVSYDSSVLHVKNKTYERAYLQSNNLYRNQTNYAFQQIAMIRVLASPSPAPIVKLSTLGAGLGLLVVTIGVYIVLFGMTFLK